MFEAVLGQLGEEDPTALNEGPEVGDSLVFFTWVLAPYGVPVRNTVTYSTRSTLPDRRL